MFGDEFFAVGLSAFGAFVYFDQIFLDAKFTVCVLVHADHHRGSFEDVEILCAESAFEELFSVL